jgi:hypothetical protein
MYSPKISEELVPVLYRLAKEKRVPMTRFVDRLIRQALTSNILPQGKLVNCQPAVSLPECEPRKAVA